MPQTSSGQLISGSEFFGNFYATQDGVLMDGQARARSASLIWANSQVWIRQPEVKAYFEAVFCDEDDNAQAPNADIVEKYQQPKCVVAISLNQIRNNAQRALENAGAVFARGTVLTTSVLTVVGTLDSISKRMLVIRIAPDRYSCTGRAFFVKYLICLCQRTWLISPSPVSFYPTLGLSASLQAALTEVQ